MNKKEKNLVWVISDDEAFQKEAAPYLKALLPPMWSLASSSYHEAIRPSHDSSPTIVLVHVGNENDSNFSLVQKILLHFENSKIVCAGDSMTVPFILKLVKLGVKDFLELPFKEEEVRSIFGEDLSQLPKDLGKVITLFSPKGGAGVTLLTTNLAVVLSKKGLGEVAICDLSPQCGDVATYLNLNPQYTLRDLIDNHQQLDTSFLKGTMLQHASGVKVLAAPREDQEPINFNHLSQLQTTVSCLRRAYDVTLIDAGHCDTALLQQALMQSDLILLIGNLDVPSLKGLVSTLSRLTRFGYDPERIKMVINRYNAKNQLSIEELEKTVSHPVASCLPNNYPLCVEAVNTGRPISDIQEGSKLAKKIAGLAEVVQKSLTLKTVDELTSTAQRRSIPQLEPMKRGFFGWLL